VDNPCRETMQGDHAGRPCRETMQGAGRGVRGSRSPSRTDDRGQDDSGWELHLPSRLLAFPASPRPAGQTPVGRGSHPPRRRSRRIALGCVRSGSRARVRCNDWWTPPTFSSLFAPGLGEEGLQLASRATPRIFPGSAGRSRLRSTARLGGWSSSRTLRSAFPPRATTAASSVRQRGGDAGQRAGGGARNSCGSSPARSPGGSHPEGAIREASHNSTFSPTPPRPPRPGGRWRFPVM